MPKNTEFSERIGFVYDYFKENYFTYGAAKPTKEAFITFLGISRGKLQSWERGYWPKDGDMRSVAQKMGVSFAWLMSGTGEPFDDRQHVLPAAAQESVWPFACPQDALRRMSQATGVPEDAWSISDYFGVPIAEASAYIDEVLAFRQAQKAYSEQHADGEAMPSPPLPDSWVEAARRRYGISPTWLGTGAGKSHEARAAEDTPELRTLRGMVDLLKENGGSSEQVQQLILEYAKGTQPAPQERGMKQDVPDAKPVYL